MMTLLCMTQILTFNCLGARNNRSYRLWEEKWSTVSPKLSDNQWKPKNSFTSYLSTYDPNLAISKEYMSNKNLSYQGKSHNPRSPSSIRISQAAEAMLTFAPVYLHFGLASSQNSFDLLMASLYSFGKLMVYDRHMTNRGDSEKDHGFSRRCFRRHCG